MGRRILKGWNPVVKRFVSKREASSIRQHCGSVGGQTLLDLTDHAECLDLDSGSSGKSLQDFKKEK